MVNLNDTYAEIIASLENFFEVYIILNLFQKVMPYFNAKLYLV